MARQFSSTTKIDVSGVFRCSSTCKATDSGSKCMLAKTTVLVPNLRTVVISENGVRIGFWPLTTAKVKILQYNSCWQSNSNGNAGIKKISTTTLEKQSNQSRPTRRQFTLDDKNSTFDHENRIATLTFTANADNSLSATIMRLSARNYDEMSIIHFRDVARKEFHFVLDFRRITRDWFAPKIESLRRR